MSDHEGQQPPTPQPSRQPRSNFRPRPKDPQAVATPTPRPRKRARWNMIGLIVGFVGLLAVAVLLGNGGKGVSMSQVQVSPPPATATDNTGAYTPSAGDWTVGVEVLNSDCSGSSGCLATFRIAPKYVGAVPLPTVGATQLTYTVEGAAEPFSGTVSVDAHGTPSPDVQQQVRTSSSSAKLTAVVTAVTFDKNR